MGGMNVSTWFRRSNLALFRDACRRPGDHRSPGPTPFQGNRVAASKLDELFVRDYLREERLASLPYASCDLVRELASGRMLRMRIFSPELSLDADGYRAIAKPVLGISHSCVLQPSAIFDHGGRLHVVRPHAVGESFVQVVERLGPLPKDAALRLSIHLLKLLVELEDHRVIGIRPSQVILTQDDQVILVDLDETEVLFFKRQLRLKTSNASVLVGKDRAFIAPEVLQGEKFDRQRALLYSFGQNLRYLLTGEWPELGESKAEKSSRRGHWSDVLDELTDLDPGSRIGTFAEALSRLRLAIQSDSSSEQSVLALPRHLEVSDRPSIRTSSLLRQLVFVLLVAVIPSLLSFGFYQNFVRPWGDENQLLQAQEESKIIESDEEFQIP